MLSASVRRALPGASPSITVTLRVKFGACSASSITVFSGLLGMTRRSSLEPPLTWWLRLPAKSCDRGIS